MATTHVNGVDIFWDEIGEGEPVLLHHGYTGAHDVWLQEIAPRLKDRYRCIVMDARGAGDSAHPDGGYTIAQYAKDVVGLADAIGLDRFTYVGHSMGGGIGYELGVNHAPRLDKLVLVAPIPAAGIDADEDMFEQAAAQRAAPDARARMIAERKVMRIRAPESAVERGVDRALSVSDGHFRESWTSMRDFDVSHRLHELTTPTLMVAGAADGLAAANVQDWLALPNATLHVFSRVGHSIPGDVPEEFSAVLADFFEHGVINAETQAQKLEAWRQENG